MASAYHAGQLDTKISFGVSSDYYNNDKTFRQKSFIRKWRQLASSQKALVLLLLSIAAVLIFVFFYHTNVPIKQLESDTEHKPHDDVKPVMNPLRQRHNREKLEQQIHSELDAKIKPLKRGPPKRNIELSTSRLKTLKVRTSKEPEEFREFIEIDGEKESDVKERNRIKDLQDNINMDLDIAHNPAQIKLTERQKYVIEAMKHAWMGYDKYAFGHDELRPLAKTNAEWFMLGLTIVDSLDTLWLMNMKEEYQKAREWVANELSFGKPTSVNLFETTIRVLGGLLSIYHLTRDHMYLQKAADLGDRLMGAFGSTSKIPYSDVVLGSKQGRPPSWGPDSSLAEVATIQLEFNDLSLSLQNPRFKSASDNVMLQIFSLPRTSGLAPIYINADSGQFRPGAAITLGARGDSYYEYLLKQWIQMGKKDEKLKEEYLTAVEGIQKLLVRKSKPNNLVFVGELLSGRSFSPKMDHLVCFLPGLLALGYFHGLPESHLELAKELTETCYQMYAQMETGLSPEIAYFNIDDKGKDDIIVKPLDAHNLLRPETVESLHIMYHVTKNKKYQEYGWNILEAFNKHCKVKTGGYVSLNNVRNADDPRPGGARDKMESFFLGETLKYLFLLFTDEDILPLDKYVFNTEAHPLPVHNS